MPDTKGPKKGSHKGKKAGTDPTSIKGRRAAPVVGLIQQVASAEAGAKAAEALKTSGAPQRVQGHTGGNKNSKQGGGGGKGR